MVPARTHPASPGRPASRTHLSETGLTHDGYRMGAARGGRATRAFFHGGPGRSAHAASSAPSDSITAVRRTERRLRVRVLVVGHTYLRRFNQRKWEAFADLSPRHAALLVVPNDWPDPHFGRVHPEPSAYPRVHLQVTRALCRGRGALTFTSIHGSSGRRGASGPMSCWWNRSRTRSWRCRAAGWRTCCPGVRSSRSSPGAALRTVGRHCR